MLVLRLTIVLMLLLLLLVHLPNKCQLHVTASNKEYCNTNYLMISNFILNLRIILLFVIPLLETHYILHLTQIVTASKLYIGMYDKLLNFPIYHVNCLYLLVVLAVLSCLVIFFLQNFSLCSKFMINKYRALMSEISKYLNNC